MNAPLGAPLVRGSIYWFFATIKMPGRRRKGGWRRNAGHPWNRNTAVAYPTDDWRHDIAVERFAPSDNNTADGKLSSEYRKTLMCAWREQVRPGYEMKTLGWVSGEDLKLRRESAHGEE